MGNPIVPVIKMTGNAATYARMGEDMDIDASTIISGLESVEQVGRRVYDLCLRVASGDQTAAEMTGHTEFSMLRYGPVY